VTSYAGVPGVVETREALGETTLVVDPARLLEACYSLRDEHGFNFLADVAAADYLGWGEQEVAEERTPRGSAALAPTQNKGTAASPLGRLTPKQKLSARSD